MFLLKILVLLGKNQYFSDFLVAMPSGPDQVGWGCREDGKLAGWPAGCLADWLLAGRLAGWFESCLISKVQIEGACADLQLLTLGPHLYPLA